MIVSDDDVVELKFVEHVMVMVGGLRLSILVREWIENPTPLHNAFLSLCLFLPLLHLKMFSQQQQQQPPATPGPLTLNHLGQQQQPQQQQYSWGTQQPAQVQPFGSQQQQQPGTPQSNYSAPQQQEHTPWIQAAAAAQQQQQQQQASSSPWSNSQAAAPQPQSTSPSQSSSSDAQYIPGYLLKLKGNRVSKASVRTASQTKPL